MLVKYGIFQLPVHPACKEMAKFCRWVARDMGRDHIDAVVRIMADAYKDQKYLLLKIIHRPTQRTFQAVHRWRDLRKIKRYPTEVTKYDIADILQFLLRQP